MASAAAAVSTKQQASIVKVNDDDDDDRAALHARWRALLLQEGAAEGGRKVDAAVVEAWWAEVEREYGGPGRHYHALSHLRQMFGEADRHSFRRPELVALATYFHDLVYDPKSGTNEEDSAERFEAFVKEARPAWLSEADVARVGAYILATKSHACPIEDNDEDEDLRLFLDIDMSVLGQPREAYLRYAGQIRREYAHVPRPSYCTARAAVLTTFLGRARLYASEHYHARLDARARENVAAEVALLRAGAIPGEEDAVEMAGS